jgi:hypothetical protein
MSVGLPCQPFGPTIQCTCDKRGQALRCLPVVELATNFKERSEHDASWNTMDWEGIEKKDNLSIDQSTEVILAFTLLIIIVLTFIL